MFDCVVFDMDGLLLDSERVSLACSVGLLAEFGVADAESIARQLIGLNDTSARKLLRQLLGPEFPLDAMRKELDRRYVAHLNEEGIPLKNGVLELLDYLEEKRIRKAVATSTETALAQTKLRRVGILDRFSHIVGGDLVTRGKPDPEPYLKAMHLLKASPSRSMALEDSNNGARSALAAGMRVVVVPDLVQPAEDVLAGAWKVVASLYDVPSLLLNATAGVQW